MQGDNDTIRRIVGELDKEIDMLQRLPRHVACRETSLAITKLQEARFWLKEMGHGGHFDMLMPTGEDE